MNIDAQQEIDAAVAAETWAHCPRIRKMSRRQMECVLSRNHVGRVAFVSDFRVEVQPVHYVYSDGALYGRSAFGTKTATWLVRPDVAFEVDEVAGLFDWRSVIVRGTVSLLRARGSPAERSAYWTAVDAIRTLVPAAFTERDPTPARALVFRVDPQEMTGREASS